MRLSGLAITMGIGAAIGAVAVTMLPKHSTAKRLVNKAADKVENAAWMVSDMLTERIDL